MAGVAPVPLLRILSNDTAGYTAMERMVIGFRDFVAKNNERDSGGLLQLILQAVSTTALNSAFSSSNLRQILFISNYAGSVVTLLQGINTVRVSLERLLHEHRHVPAGFIEQIKFVQIFLSAQHGTVRPIYSTICEANSIKSADSKGIDPLNKLLDCIEELVSNKIKLADFIAASRGSSEIADPRYLTKLKTDQITLLHSTTVSGPPRESGAVAGTGEPEGGGRPPTHGGRGGAARVAAISATTDPTPPPAPACFNRLRLQSSRS